MEMPGENATACDRLHAAWGRSLGINNNKMCYNDLIEKAYYMEEIHAPPAR